MKSCRDEISTFRFKESGTGGVFTAYSSSYKATSVKPRRIRLFKFKAHLVINSKSGCKIFVALFRVGVSRLVLLQIVEYAVKTPPGHIIVLILFIVNTNPEGVTFFFN
jgi:hypothetical protein